MTVADTASGDLHLVRLTKMYGDAAAVDDLSLTIPQGSFFALLGPSGCGKTTTLRMVAGLEQPTQGAIHLGETDVTGMKPYKRPVNTVFQSYALFPHLDIFENVAFGLRRRGIKDVDAQVAQMLELVELTGFEKRKPNQLSGGQQQRVAVARALINHPSLLLLDEPLGALDLKLRRQMQLELKRIQTEVGITFVHVTHDQEEAMTMADTVAVMNAGKIEQLGSPVELYENPMTAFVANFLGQSNMVDGMVVDRAGDDVVVDISGQRLAIPRSRVHTDASSVHVGVRPEKVSIVSSEDAEAVPAGHNRMVGVIEDVSFMGVSTEYTITLPWGGGFGVFAQNLRRDDRLVPAAEVTVHWAPEHTFALDPAEPVDAGIDPDARLLGVAGRR
jgi:spermidine/putrescine transport system ATP-binding protein